jgi:peptidoglycan/LPS O-acetylase OafA/YrhL
MPGRENFSRPLHAMRGIAAIIVMFRHSFEPVGWIDPAYEAFSPLLNAAAAVSFFFVLSGLVLTLSVSRRPLDAPHYVRYVVRRLFRLLPLLWFTAALGGIYLFALDARMPMQFTQHGSLDIPKFIAGFIGYSLRPNPPSWSIFVELVISLLLPFIWSLYRSRYRWLLVLATIAASSTVMGLQHHWNFFLINFLAGMSIVSWGGATKRLSKPAFWFLFIALSVLFYSTRPLYLWHIEEPGNDLFGFPWINLAEVALVTPLVAMVFYNGERFRVLEQRVFDFLGEASFSIYLMHWIIIALSANALLAMWPNLVPNLFAPALALLVVALTLPLSWVSHKWIELPGMALGEALASRIGQMKAIQAA